MKRIQKCISLHERQAITWEKIIMTYVIKKVYYYNVYLIFSMTPCGKDKTHQKNGKNAVISYKRNTNYE